VLSIEVGKEKLHFRVMNDKSITVEIYGEKQVIDSRGVTVAIPDCWRG